MQIFTSKRFRFRNPGVSTVVLLEQPSSAVLQNAFFNTKPLEIQEAPDWIASDPLFQWAQDAGDLKVFAPAAPAPSAESDSAPKKNAKTDDKPEAKPEAKTEK